MWLPPKALTVILFIRVMTLTKTMSNHDPMSESCRKILLASLSSVFLVYPPFASPDPFSTLLYPALCEPRTILMGSLDSWLLLIFDQWEAAKDDWRGRRRIKSEYLPFVQGFPSLVSSLYLDHHVCFWQLFPQSSLILQVLVTTIWPRVSSIHPVSSSRLRHYFLRFPYTLPFLRNQCFMKFFSHYPIWIRV